MYDAGFFLASLCVCVLKLFPEQNRIYLHEGEKILKVVI